MRTKELSVTIGDTRYSRGNWPNTATAANLAGLSLGVLGKVLASTNYSMTNSVLTSGLLATAVTAVGYSVYKKEYGVSLLALSSMACSGRERKAPVYFFMGVAEIANLFSNIHSESKHLIPDLKKAFERRGDLTILENARRHIGGITDETTAEEIRTRCNRSIADNERKIANLPAPLAANLKEMIKRTETARDTCLKACKESS
ncbi:MAG: hypothetical protein SNF33_00375 [Candidatus Algichlamydia australiensis]|nr:hypothetical protein [Chlamydiales bacterium]